MANTTHVNHLEIGFLTLGIQKIPDNQPRKYFFMGKKAARLISIKMNFQ